MSDSDPSAFFLKIADKLLTEKQITKGTILGFPCQKLNEEFLATADHRTGDLIVKLPGARVTELIHQGEGEAFTLVGRKFND